MHRRSSWPKWAVMMRHDVPDRTDPSRVYLRRLYVVKTPYFGVYLHRILLPDGDRDPHDHPWVFGSLVLSGGYTEEIHEHSSLWPGDPAQTWTRTETHEPGSWHRMPLHLAHKITEIRPGTRTLVLVGRRRKAWGFWTPAGWVLHSEYDDGGVGPDPSETLGAL